MLKSAEVKQLLYDMGADLCGIASIDRFDEAPEGFHPRDVLPSCKSVIVFAKKFSAGTLQCKTTIPYTITRNILSDKLDKMSIQFCAAMEEKGVIATPTGTIGPGVYDDKTGRSRMIVSAKHCAVAAGLGWIGKNTLVTTPEYGNMVWLNAILCDAELEPDKVLPSNPCKDDCSLCVDNCPVHALDGPEMNQVACRLYAFHTEAGEQFKFKCYTCRTICPNCFGSKNIQMKPAM